MKNALLVSMVLLLIVLPVSAARSRVALFDFTVYSENSEYKHIGKGFTELISLELRKSPGIILVNRRKCLEFLEERSMSIEDLDDSKMPALVSEILKADYLILGEIYDADNRVTISLQMIKGTTSEVVWKEELTENLSNYEFISASFTQSILARLGAKIPESTTEKAKLKTGKDEEAFIAFSTAVDYLDRKDKQRAKTVLIRAAEIDPESEAIKIYLQKMEWSINIMSPKFRIEPELHTSAYNPASLGFIDQDQFYYWMTISSPPFNQAGEHQLIDVYSVRDEYSPMKTGYMMPLGERLGLGIEYMGGYYDHMLLAPVAFMFDFQGSPVYGLYGFTSNYGGNVSVGYRFLDDMSLGASVLIWYTKNDEEETFDKYIVDNGVYFAIEGGYMLKALEGRLTFDFRTVYTNQAERYVDFSSLSLEIKEGALPLLVEASVASDFLNRKLFLSLTGISDIYIDGRGGYVFRAIPVAEYWPFPFLALRAGGEYSHMDQVGELAVGYGILAGISVRFWRIELNTNFTIRKKPIRFLPGHTYTDWTLLIGGTFTPTLLTR